MIPKSRLDALTDGVFAAMTLLVIDLRLPENFRPADATELLFYWLDRQLGRINRTLEGL
jgi:uncharacterized membrane protein